MPRYHYRATDSQGNSFEDFMEAESAEQVVTALSEAGLTVSSVDQSNQSDGIQISKSLTWAELHQFVQQLHAITRSGLPLPAALRTLAGDMRSPKLAAVLEKLRRDIERGFSLDEALARQRHTFPPHFIDIIRAGQAAGNLSEVLLIYLRHTERMMSISNALKGALTYPLLIALVIFVVMGLLVMFVVPVYGDVFAEFGIQPPTYIAFWLRISDFLRDYWPYLVLGGMGLCALIYVARRMASRMTRGRMVLDWLYLHLPVLGSLRYMVVLVRFSRTLALLLESRVPLAESLELSGNVADSALLHRAVRKAIPHALGGERIADALAGTGFFPHHFCWLVAAGEDRGDIEPALNNVSDAWEREIMYRSKILSAILEPAVILVLGILVASISLSLYGPLYWFAGAMN